MVLACDLGASQAGILGPHLLHLFEGIMRRRNQFPPILTCVVECNTAVGVLSGGAGAAIDHRIIVYTLHYLMTEIVLMCRLSLYLVV